VVLSGDFSSVRDDVVVGEKVEKQMMIIKIVYFSPLRQNIIQYKYK